MDNWKKIYTNLLNHGYSPAQATLLIGRCYRLSMNTVIAALFKMGEEDILDGTANDEEAGD